MSVGDQPAHAPRQFRVRRLAVIDLHGFGGTRVRRVLVRIEFVGAVAIGVALAVLFIRTGTGWGIILGIVAGGIAANYLVLVVWAVLLWNPLRLAREFAAHDVASDGRHQSVSALLLFVPYVFVPLALRAVEREA